MRRSGIKHNDLTHYFLRPHEELPRAYLASCEKFFKELSNKQQEAPSTKRQAPSSKLQAPRPALMMPQLKNRINLERRNYENK